MVKVTPFGTAHSQPRVMASRDVANLLQQLLERQRLPIQYVRIEGGSVVGQAFGISNEDRHQSRGQPLAASIRALE
jgi:hypothetical protein